MGEKGKGGRGVLCDDGLYTGVNEDSGTRMYLIGASLPGIEATLQDALYTTVGEVGGIC
jgi:hypothetical protein